MESPDSLNPYCQIACVPKIGQTLTRPELGPQPLRRRVKLLLKRMISTETKRAIKKKADRLVWVVRGRDLPAEPSPNPAVKTLPEGLKPGDRVRIRTREEIEATLDMWGELRGCGFIPEMAQYYGTVHTVWKPVQRFVDERDYRVKKTRGIYLLEGVFCEGRELFGRCDRGCFYFWREEWLEKLRDTPEGDADGEPHQA